MPKSFDWYRGKIAEMMTNDSESYEIFYQVDKMYHGEITLPQQLQDFDDVRIIKDSSPHDALYNATVALANSRIRLDVTPLGDAEAEFVQANRMEQALQWNWEKANMRGAKRKIESIADSALRYDGCVTRVDDLMFWLPKDKSKWSKANKRAARLGRFVLAVIPPHNIHVQSSDISGTFCVLSARNLALSEVLDYYESIAGTNKEGAKIKATLRALREEVGEQEGYEEQRFMLYQYTDDDKRLDYGHLMGEDNTIDDSGGTDADHVFIDTENKLPFINYTARLGGSEVETDPKYKYHPMLASAHWHELWQNSVLARSLVFSDIIRRIRETREFYRGSNTELVPPDDGAGGAKALPPNVDVVRPQPTTVDPQAFQVLEELAGSLLQTTSASALGNLSRYSNTAFSTMNAIVQVEMGKLNPQKNIIQDTIADQCYLFCEWAKFTKVPIQAWREEPAKVGETQLPRGEEIQIGEGDYDLYRTFIKCTITPETPTDKMQQMNIVEKLVLMGMSAEEALEMMNVPHAGLQKDKRALEILKDGKVQALIAKFTALAQGDAQVETAKKMAVLQQAQAQAAQQQTQPSAPSGLPAGPQAGAEPSPLPVATTQTGTPFEGMGGSGVNPAEMGTPPVEGAPGMGREQMNGQTRTGEDIAA